MHQRAERGGIHRCRVDGAVEVVNRRNMNPAILAYTQLPGQLPPAIAAQLRAAVPYGRRMRLAQGAAAIASLLGMALARVLLAEVQGQPAASLTLQFPYRKKPFSPGGADFSLSHSGN